MAVSTPDDAYSASYRKRLWPGARLGTVVLTLLVFATICGRMLDRLEIRRGPAFAAAHGALMLWMAAQLEFEKDTEAGWLRPRTIEAARATQCADRRDHVYSLLGIMQPYLDIRVDYTMRVRDLYEDGTLAMVRAMQSLDLLILCGEPSYDQLPSWVVPFSSPETAELSRRVMALSPEKHDPSRGAHFTLFSPHRGVLEVSGCSIDAVEHVAPSGWSDLDRTVQAWRDVYTRHIICGNKLHQSTSGKDEFAKTLYWGPLLDEDQQEGYYDEFELACERGVLDQVMSPNARASWLHSTFFLTRRACLGIATGVGSVREGDSIYVLAGSRKSTVLREGQHKAFRVVAAAYVHGKRARSAPLAKLAVS